MATKPIDYAALAKQYGAVSSQAPGVDYNALAKQYGAISSQPAPQPNATGLANIALRGTGITVGAPKDPSVNAVKDVGSVDRFLTAAGASLTRRGEGQKPILGQGRSPLEVMSEQPLAYGSPSSVKEMIAEPATRIGEGDVAGGIGDVTGMAAQQYLLGKAGERLSGPAGKLLAKDGIQAAKDSVSNIPQKLSDKYYESRTSAVRATEPSAASLPPQATFGVEKVYRAAAPVGSDPQFRSNLYKAAGDLAEIGRAAEANLESAKGGVIQPDMRVRATVNAINDHLAEMYKQERAPQIARHDTNLIDASLSTDAKGGLDYLANNAGESATRSLAQKAINSPDMSLADADVLARTVNKELLKFESLEAPAKAAAEQTNAKISGLKDLDRELSQKINNELIRNGEEGLGLYEQRYAALSKVRTQLQKRMNAVELDQPGLMKKVLQPVSKALTGGKTAIASASQAAVADVNIGKTLQQGLYTLAKTKLTATRSAPRPAVRGLLNAPPTQLGSSLTPTTPTSAPQPALERPYNPTGAMGAYDLPDLRSRPTGRNVFIPRKKR